MAIDDFLSRLTILAALTSILANGCGHAEPAVPVRLAVVPAHFYLAPEDEDAEALFQVRNESSETIRILHMTSSCGCAVPTLPTSVLAPGETVQVQVGIVRPPTGTNSATVTLFTDSVISPTTTLNATFAASGDGVAAMTNVTPQHIVLEKNFAASRLSADVTVTTIERASEHFIVGVDSDLPFVNVTKTRETDSAPLFNTDFVQRQYVFTLSLDESAPVGAVSGTLLIRNESDTPHPLNTIHVQAIVDGLLVANPRSLFAQLPVNDSQSLPTWRVTVVSGNPTAKFQIASVETTVDWLEAAMRNSPGPGIASESNESEVELSVSLIGVPSEVEGEGEVVVTTMDGVRLAIPVVVSRPRVFTAQHTEDV